MFQKLWFDNCIKTRLQCLDHWRQWWLANLRKVIPCLLYLKNKNIKNIVKSLVVSIIVPFSYPWFVMQEDMTSISEPIILHLLDFYRCHIIDCFFIVLYQSKVGFKHQLHNIKWSLHTHESQAGYTNLLFELLYKYWTPSFALFSNWIVDVSLESYFWYH